MAFRVELTDRAARDLSMLFLEIRANDSEGAARWSIGCRKPLRA
jgi:hypothetical protein